MPAVCRLFSGHVQLKGFVVCLDDACRSPATRSTDEGVVSFEASVQPGYRVMSTGCFLQIQNIICCGASRAGPGLLQ